MTLVVPAEAATAAPTGRRCAAASTSGDLVRTAGRLRRRAGGVGAARPHRARRHERHRPAEWHRRRDRRQLVAVPAGHAHDAVGGGARVLVGQRRRPRSSPGSSPSSRPPSVSCCASRWRSSACRSWRIGPLLRVVYGTGDGPQVTLAALAVFYTTLVPVIVGLRAVPQTWSDLVASYGRGRLRTLTTVRARACVPYLFAGLQVAAPAAFLGALVGEFTGAERGLGLLTINAMRGLRTDELWAVATISALVSMAAYLLVGAVGRRLAIGQPALLLAPPPAAPVRGRRRGGSAAAAVEIAITIGRPVGLWVGPDGAVRPRPVLRQAPGRRLGVPGHRSPTAAANRREIIDALGSDGPDRHPRLRSSGLLLGAGAAAVFELSQRGAADRRRRSMIALRCVPIVAIAPLLVQAFGRGVAGTTTTVAIMTFFPTLVACSYGLRQTPGQVLDLYAVYDTGRDPHAAVRAGPGDGAGVLRRGPHRRARHRPRGDRRRVAGDGHRDRQPDGPRGRQQPLRHAVVVRASWSRRSRRSPTAWSCIIERLVLRRVAPEQLAW